MNVTHFAVQCSVHEIGFPSVAYFFTEFGDFDASRNHVIRLSVSNFGTSACPGEEAIRFCRVVHEQKVKYFV